jgi:hypothetical protein
VALIADNRDEPLLTMAEPSDHPVRTLAHRAGSRRCPAVRCAHAAGSCAQRRMRTN